MENIDKKMYNGRVNIVTPDTKTQFALYDKIPVKVDAFQDALQGNVYNTQLSDAYFSRENIQIIQNALKKGVYDKSNGNIVIDNQSEDKIVSVMRSMYLQHSKNLNTNIREQITELNKHVLNFCVPNVYSEAVAYLKYKQDASTMHMPMNAPLYSSKTNKTLEMKPFF